MKMQKCNRTEWELLECVPRSEEWACGNLLLVLVEPGV